MSALDQKHDDSNRAPRGRLRSIDALRGIAAFGVLLAHIVHHRSDGVPGLRMAVGLLLDFGTAGVSLFVVISGFCIHLSVARTLAREGTLRADWSAFWRRRFHRLYPPYLAAIALGLIAYGLCRDEALGPFQRVSYLPGDVLAHLLMVQNLFVPYWAGVGNFPLWTLGMEEQLYALYAIYLVLRRRFTAASIVVLTFLVGLLWEAAGLWVFPEHVGPLRWAVGVWRFWPCSLWWFNWVLGAVAAEAYVGVLSLPRWAFDRCGMLALLGFGLLTSDLCLGRFGNARALTAIVGTTGFVPELFRLLIILSAPAKALGFFVLLNRLVRAEVLGASGGPMMGAFAGLGIFSYSLYLTHVPVLMLAESMLRLDDRVTAVLIRYLVLVPLCVGVAWVFFLGIESRFLNTKRTHPQMTQRDAD